MHNMHTPAGGFQLWSDLFSDFFPVQQWSASLHQAARDSGTFSRDESAAGQEENPETAQLQERGGGGRGGEGC